MRGVPVLCSRICGLLLTRRDRERHLKQTHEDASMPLLQPRMALVWLRQDHGRALENMQRSGIFPAKSGTRSTQDHDYLSKVHNYCR